MKYLRIYLYAISILTMTILYAAEAIVAYVFTDYIAVPIAMFGLLVIMYLVIFYFEKMAKLNIDK